MRTTNLEVDSGTVLYDESTKVAKWNIGKLTPDKLPRLGNDDTTTSCPKRKKHASKNQHRADSNEIIDSPPIQMHWKVPMASLGSLQLYNEDYKPYKRAYYERESFKYIFDPHKGLYFWRMQLRFLHNNTKNKNSINSKTHRNMVWGRGSIVTCFMMYCSDACRECQSNHPYVVA